MDKGRLNNASQREIVSNVPVKLPFQYRIINNGNGVYDQMRNEPNLHGLGSGLAFAPYRQEQNQAAPFENIGSTSSSDYVEPQPCNIEGLPVNPRWEGTVTLLPDSRFYPTSWPSQNFMYSKPAIGGTASDIPGSNGYHHPVELMTKAESCSLMVPCHDQTAQNWDAHHQTNGWRPQVQRNSMYVPLHKSLRGTPKNSNHPNVREDGISTMRPEKITGVQVHRTGHGLAHSTTSRDAGYDTARLPFTADTENPAPKKGPGVPILEGPSVRDFKTTAQSAAHTSRHDPSHVGESRVGRSKKSRAHHDVTQGRRKRVLTPEGKVHASSLRRSGGACDICRQKKIKVDRYFKGAARPKSRLILHSVFTGFRKTLHVSNLWVNYRRESRYQQVILVRILVP